MTRDKRRAELAALAGLLALVAIGAGVWAMTRPSPPGQGAPPAVTPAPETSTAALPASESAVASAPAEPAQPETRTTDTSSTAAPAKPVPQVDGPRMAFHAGSKLRVTTQDGSGVSTISVSGTAYALSPDGRTVAAVQHGKLVFVHLVAGNGSTQTTPGLTARSVAPVWLPDSSGVIYVRDNGIGGTQVWLAETNGSPPSFIAAGESGAVSPDGTVIAVIPAADAASPTLFVWSKARGTASVPLPPGDPVAVALGKDRVFVSTVSSADDPAIWSMALDGTDRHKIVGASTAPEAATYGQLSLSPDGSKLLYCVDGDDGYSRMFVVPTGGGTPVKISGRRDGYPIAWANGGHAILFIEGNSYQGEQTGLYRSDLAGHNRKLLVAGARL